tara:strand:+ start:8958 stop:9368 length:411 start_codon:yes stop_codon:yes gene_type:complete
MHQGSRSAVASYSPIRGACQLLRWERIARVVLGLGVVGVIVWIRLGLWFGLWLWLWLWLTQGLRYIPFISDILSAKQMVAAVLPKDDVTDLGHSLSKPGITDVDTIVVVGDYACARKGSDYRGIQATLLCELSHFI